MNLDDGAIRLSGFRDRPALSRALLRFQVLSSRGARPLIGARPIRWAISCVSQLNGGFLVASDALRGASWVSPGGEGLNGAAVSPCPLLDSIT